MTPNILTAVDNNNNIVWPVKAILGMKRLRFVSRLFTNITKRVAFVYMGRRRVVLDIYSHISNRFVTHRHSPIYILVLIVLHTEFGLGF